MINYKQIALHEVEAGDDVFFKDGSIMRVTKVELLDSLVCLHGYWFGTDDFDKLLGTSTDVSTSKVTRVRND